MLKWLITKIKKVNHPVLVASDMEAGPGTAIVGTTEFPSIRQSVKQKKKD